MAYEHKSGVPAAYDRAVDHPEWQSVVARETDYVQAADINDAQTIIRRRHNNLGSIITREGSRVAGAEAVVSRDPENAPTGQVLLTAGKLFIGGDVLPVAMAVLNDVPMTGRVKIGVERTTLWIGSEQDTSLLGLHPGTKAEGEEGSYREAVSIAWTLISPGDTGDLISVYELLDGAIIDQSPPPALTGIQAAIAGQDFGAHGHYIVRGCRVTALGKSGNDQVFSIEEGEANILGYKRTRYHALRTAHTEDFDIEAISGETHSWPGGATATFVLNRVPIASVAFCLVTKEVTETVTRGAVAGTSDALAHSSVTEILEVKQGATTFTTYVRSGDRVDWSPAGAEPAASSTYQVKYRYLAEVVPSTITDTAVTLAGGVTGTPVIIGYSFKVPRIDLLCLDSNGEPVYVKGVSARDNPLPPATPGTLLMLARITNNWMTKPTVENLGRRSIPFDEQWAVNNMAFDLVRLLQLERLKSGIDSREPVAKKGVFVDPLVDDTYRDAGVVQTASVGGGVIELAIAPTFYQATLTEPVLLDYVHEAIIIQDFVTGCMKINPYQNFQPMPAGLKLSPYQDFWVESQTVWASPITLEFNRGVRRDNGPLVALSSSTEVVDNRKEQLEYLRQINVAFEISGFGAGEHLQTLTFDGINVKPAGVQTANAAGVISGTFTIPQNVAAGTKLVQATGQGGSYANASFTGRGALEITVKRQANTVERWQSAPVTRVETPRSGSRSGDYRHDPLAQTFRPVEPRQLTGVEFRICHIGDPSNALLVQQTTVENGFPTEAVRAEAFVPMTGVATGWKQALYTLPVYTTSERSSAVVIKTDDADHSLSIAKLGGFDQVKQMFVGAQPNTTGVLLSSADAITWTAHQDEDLTLRILAAKYTSTTKTVALGSFDLVNCSDLQVRADVELPSGDCSVTFELVRANGDVIRLQAYQVLQLTSYITETVQLRAVLKGTEKLSPILYAPVLLVAGSIAQSGTYVTRAFNLGANVRLTPYFKAFLPSGATVNVKYDKADGNWIDLPYVSGEQLAFPFWTEDKHEATGITATQGRLKITITGGPEARPLIGDLGAGIF